MGLQMWLFVAHGMVMQRTRWQGSGPCTSSLAHRPMSRSEKQRSPARSLRREGRWVRLESRLLPQEASRCNC